MASAPSRGISCSGMKRIAIAEEPLFWLLRSAAARSLEISGGTRLEDLPRIRSDRAVLHALRREREEHHPRGGDAHADTPVDRATAAQRDTLRTWAQVPHPRPRRQVRSGLRPCGQGRWDSRRANRCEGAADELRVRTILGSVRRECLDHLIVLSETHLQRVLADYALGYFNNARPQPGDRPAHSDPRRTRWSPAPARGHRAPPYSAGCITTTARRHDTRGS